MQLEMAEQTKLPMFIHCRNAATDLIEILEKNRDRLYGGVVCSIFIFNQSNVFNNKILK